MKDCIDKIVRYCYKNGYISENQLPWLRYSIEKRLSSIVGIIPFTFLAFLLSDFWCALFFISSFCFLRGRINGFHAKTLIGCLCISLATELILFMVIYPLLNPTIAVVIWVACLVILLLGAPYNHPNMHYSMDEVFALKKSIRHRAIILTTIFLIALSMQASSSLQGLTLGIAMAAFMLCLAYISDWRKT